MDHGFDLDTRFVILGDKARAFDDQGVLSRLQGLVFRAEFLGLFEQFTQLLLESLQVFSGLF